MPEVWELLFWDDEHWITLGRFSDRADAQLAYDDECRDTDQPWKVLKVRKVGAHG